MPAQIRGHSTAGSDKEAGKDKAAVNIMLLQYQQAKGQLVLRENLKGGALKVQNIPQPVSHIPLLHHFWCHTPLLPQDQLLRHSLTP